MERYLTRTTYAKRRTQSAISQFLTTLLSMRWRSMELYNTLLLLLRAVSSHLSPPFKSPKLSSHILLRTNADSGRRGSNRIRREGEEARPPHRSQVGAVPDTHDHHEACSRNQSRASTLAHIFSYLGRNALANARIQGLNMDLGLKGSQFNNTAISVLFAGFIALQFPSNATITRTRPSVYLVLLSSP